MHICTLNNFNTRQIRFGITFYMRAWAQRIQKQNINQQIKVQPRFHFSRDLPLIFFFFLSLFQYVNKLMCIYLNKQT